jgi:predicted acylesterase/phospholipase RssA
VRGKRLLIPRGLVQGQKLTQFLRRAMLPVAGAADFDHLPTRLRVVATDLESGDTVVMRDGDLVTAVRASMSAPGFFAPVEREGRLLVEGGLTENLPVDVARAMGVDVLIVVDTGFALQKRSHLNSLPAVSNQAIAIVLRKNIDAQRAHHATRPAGRPQLERLSSTGSIARARRLGASAARGRRPARAVHGARGERYAAARPGAIKRRSNSCAATPARRRRQQIDDLFGVPTSRSTPTLGRRVTSLYGRGVERSITRSRDSGRRQSLNFSARRNSAGTDCNLACRCGTISPAASFNAAAALLFTELNSLGAESVWDMRIGSRRGLRPSCTCHVQRAALFSSPHGGSGAQRRAARRRQQIGEYRLRTQAEPGPRPRLSNIGEIAAASLRSSGSAGIIVGGRHAAQVRRARLFRALPLTISTARCFRAGRRYVRWRGEDNVSSWQRPADGRLANAGRRGSTGIAGVGGTAGGGGRTCARGSRSAASISRACADSRRAVLRHRPRDRAASAAAARACSTCRPMPGYRRDRQRLELTRDIDLGSTRRDVALFLGADTYIGPVYIAAGYDDAGHSGFYLFLGRSF